MSDQKDTRLPRRRFLQQAAAATAGFTIVPRHVLARSGQTPPSDRFNVAGIGIGGMGRSNMLALASQNIVALCDVDWNYAGEAWSEQRFDDQIAQLEARLKEPPQQATDAQFGRLSAEQVRARAQQQLEDLKRVRESLPRIKRYVDYREMLEKQKDIDGVVIATPDHLHAIQAVAAMDLGKHVYVQKPLTWSVAEARLLAKKARETKVATQMGNQGHSSNDARLVNEYIWAGTIGEVREVHVWTNRPLAYWPQGIPRPTPLQPGTEVRWNMNGVMAQLADAMAHNRRMAPDKLNWDLFLGPAPYVEYHPVYHPFNWRGWVDWGVGAIGDMGAHLIDHPFWALDLGFPTSVETVSTPFNQASYPAATMTFYEFPARNGRPPVKLTWYDGGLLPPKPEELGDEQLNRGGGVLYIGTKGKLLHDNYGYNPRLLPKSLAESAKTPPQKLPRITTSHEMNWVEAAKGKTEASCPFEYAARLTEVMLLGIVALRAGGKIYYDGENMRITNNSAANSYLTREYRRGWNLT
ncbi:MAG TPA: Gfo/Idh/MocA family oxidoreductase [Vicinamibacterales bacterium]